MNLYLCIVYVLIGTGFIIYSYFLLKVMKEKLHREKGVINSNKGYLSESDKKMLKISTILVFIGLILFVLFAIFFNTPR